MSDDGGRQTASFDDCTELSPLCPVEATVLGYTPNLGSSIFFTIAFGLCLIAAAVLGVWKKTWTFGAAITAGLILEMSGYIGRALLYNNPWDSNAFQLQICAIILGPTFICAAIYLTLKHIALTLNPAISRFQPKLYPRIFLPADLSCLVVQAIGGGVAASAKQDNVDLLNTGNDLIIAGIVLQVVVLLVFGILGVDYLVRVKKYMAGADVDVEAKAVWESKKFKTFLYAVVGAYLSVFIRCIYRIAEMQGGWGNHIMQDEISFLVLDPTLMTITVYLLTIFHPGLWFPQMSNGYRKEAATSEKHTAGETGESSNEGAMSGSISP